MSEEYNPESSERIKELKEKLNDMANTAFVQEGQIKELEKKLADYEKEFRVLRNDYSERFVDLTLARQNIFEMKKVAENETKKFWEAVELLKEYNSYIKKDNAIARKIGTTVDDFLKKHEIKGSENA